MCMIVCSWVCGSGGCRYMCMNVCVCMRVCMCVWVCVGAVGVRCQDNGSGGCPNIGRGH